MAKFKPLDLLPYLCSICQVLLSPANETRSPLILCQRCFDYLGRVGRKRVKVKRRERYRRAHELISAGAVTLDKVRRREGA